MKIIHGAEELRAELAAHRVAGEKIGFVPTMGALHEGHAALLGRAQSESAVAVLSVFVNPTQFGPQEDFSRYPRTLEADAEIARREGVKYLFAPAVEEIYPPGFSTFIEVEGVSAPLCGRFRPGHFRGVATVVHRLFTLVRPDVAYFGQKDLQQCLVIERMVKDLELPLRIEVVPTVREADGLALSSRNRYLTPVEREQALVIFRALSEAKKLYAGGERAEAALVSAAKRVLAEVPEFEVQYCEMVPGTFCRGGALAIAGFLGKTRLIDNILLGDPKS